MPKIVKHAEFLDTLRNMVTKEATASTGTAASKPGADTHYTSVSKETETVNKNEQGHPEKNPQDFKQEPAKDKSDPTKKHSEEIPAADAEKAAADALATSKALPDTGKAEKAKDAPLSVSQKAAEEKPEENQKLAELGKQLLDAIKNAQHEQTKEATASTGTAASKPGADTHYVSVSKATETVNKNEQGHPEKNPQDFKQEPAKDKSDPTKKHSEEISQEELDKQASFELGRQFCRSFLQTKVASSQEIHKQAGRRDFESLIAQAASELEYEQNQKAAQAQQVQAQQKQASAVYDEQQAEKLAEEQGAQAFYAMMKQAQEEYQAEQIKQAFEQRLAVIANEKAAVEKRAAELEAKLQEKEAAMQKKAEEEKRAQEFHTWGNYVVDQVMEKLRSESAK